MWHQISISGFLLEIRLVSIYSVSLEPNWVVTHMGQRLAKGLQLLEWSKSYKHTLFRNSSGGFVACMAGAKRGKFFCKHSWIISPLSLLFLCLTHRLGDFGLPLEKFSLSWKFSICETESYLLFTFQLNFWKFGLHGKQPRFSATDMGKQVLDEPKEHVTPRRARRLSTCSNQINIKFPLF